MSNKKDFYECKYIYEWVCFLQHYFSVDFFVVDRPTQLICISDIYLLTDKYKRQTNTKEDKRQHKKTKDRQTQKKPDQSAKLWSFFINPSNCLCFCVLCAKLTLSPFYIPLLESSLPNLTITQTNLMHEPVHLLCENIWILGERKVFVWQTDCIFGNNLDF